MVSFADLYFRTYSGDILSGTTERIQQTSTPFDENSRGNRNHGSGGSMHARNDPKPFFLMANQVATGSNIFFRVIASKSGFADGISQRNCPYNITSDTPPIVTSLTISPKGTGTGSDFSHPIILSPGSFTIEAVVKPAAGRTIKTLKLLVDGDTRFSGYIAPGHSAGAQAVIGDFTQVAEGTLVVEDGGAGPNQI